MNCGAIDFPLRLVITYHVALCNIQEYSVKCTLHYTNILIWPTYYTLDRTCSRVQSLLVYTHACTCTRVHTHIHTSILIRALVEVCPLQSALTIGLGREVSVVIIHSMFHKNPLINFLSHPEYKQTDRQTHTCKNITSFNFVDRGDDINFNCKKEYINMIKL